MRTNALFVTIRVTFSHCLLSFFFLQLPLSLLKTAQGHPMLVELKNGETYNGHLVNCDTWMNIHLREVICTSKDGDRFWRMPECYIRGNTIKYLRVPDEVIDKVQEETKSRTDRKPPGVGRGRGRGREDGPGGRQPKGIGRGLDEGGPKGQGGRGRGGPGGKPGGNRDLGVEGEVEVDLGTDMELQMGQLLLLKALVPVQNSYYLCYVSCVLLILGFQLFSCIYSHKNGVYYGPHQSFYANIVFRCLLRLKTCLCSSFFLRLCLGL
ncbi:putative U6 snRNA-associated Sm-like protein LSm4 [Glycine soja]